MQRRRAGRILRIEQVRDRQQSISRASRDRDAAQRRSPRPLSDRRASEELLADLGPEVRALIDPRAQNADLVIRQRPGRRHLHAAVAMDERA